MSPTDKVFDQLRSHLQEKICDGNGETLFEVGVGAGEDVRRDIFYYILFEVTESFDIKAKICSFTGLHFI